jgi:formyl-CoA transferase
MEETPMQVRRAPLLGEHNLEIYGQMGFSSRDLDALKREGVI